MDFRSKKILKLSLHFLIIGFLLFSSHQGFTQKRKSYLKKKNKMISNYRGGSIRFSKNKRYLSAEFNVSVLNYFGDIAPSPKALSTDLGKTRPGLGIGLTYRVLPYLSVRGNFDWGRIQADDLGNDKNDRGENGGFYRYARNLQFRNDLKELSFTAVYDIFSNHGTFLNRVNFTPYVFAGFSVFHHNPKGKVPDQYYDGSDAEEAGQWVALRPLGTEGQNSNQVTSNKYSNFSFGIPMGIGARFALGKRIDFSFEFQYKYTFTDYLDDVGGNYVDPWRMDSKLAITMADRSLEPIAVVSGEARDLELLLNPDTGYRIIQKTAPADAEYFAGETFSMLGGFGHETGEGVPPNKRGSSSNDGIFVTTFKIAYIISGSFQRAKFR